MVFIHDVKSAIVIFLSKSNNEGKSVIKCRNGSPNTTIQNTAPEPGATPNLNRD